MISLYVESKCYSPVDLKVFPLLGNQENLYLELFRLRYQGYKSKECIKKLYLNLGLILNLCKSSLRDNYCKYINNLI